MLGIVSKVSIYRNIGNFDETRNLIGVPIDGGHVLASPVLADVNDDDQEEMIVPSTHFGRRM